MNAVVQLRDYALRRNDVLVLVDVHQGTDGAVPSEQVLRYALGNCHAALSCSRERGTPVAFVRRRGSGIDVPNWQAGFTPQRDEMLFERRGHSCYASEPFAAMVDAAGGRFVLAGLFGETSCLATVIDAQNHGHNVTFLADASVSRGLAGLSDAELHKVTTAILGLHGAAIGTSHWLAVS